MGLTMKLSIRLNPHESRVLATNSIYEADARMGPYRALSELTEDRDEVARVAEVEETFAGEFGRFVFEDASEVGRGVEE